MMSNLEADKKCKKKILLVDDDEAMNKTSELVLRRYGYDVVVATRSKEALRLVQAVPDKFDLVITDMKMDEINGVQLCKMIKQIVPEIPIVLCTGLISVNQKDMIETGIVETIQKPFTIGELISIVAGLIGE